MGWDLQKRLVKVSKDFVRRNKEEKKSSWGTFCKVTKDQAWWNERKGYKVELFHQG